MALASFDETRFPEKISFGVSGGPEWFTSITTTHGGFEQRNINWEQARYRFRMEHAIKDTGEIETLMDFYNARRGMGIGFRFRDFLDFMSDMQGNVLEPPAADADDLPSTAAMTPVGIKRVNDTTEAEIGIGDGTEVSYQLGKSYVAGVGTDYFREIKKPVGTTSANAKVRIFVNAVLQTETTHYTIVPTTGVITFVTAPPDSQTVEADFLYDVPVRFNTDLALFTLESFDNTTWPGIEMIELRLT